MTKGPFCGIGRAHVVGGCENLKLFVRDRLFYRSFFSLTGMLALQNIITFSVNLADNMMLSRYSTEAMTGASTVNQIQYLLQMLVMGVGEGVIVLASQYWGKRDTAPIRRMASIGLWLGTAMALLMGAVAFAAPRQVLGLLTNQQAYIDEGVKYLRIICFSYPLFAMTNVLLATLRSVETVRIGMLVSGSTLLINCCLNYLLIYGNLGAPELGIRGAAIATLISRIVELVIVGVYVGCLDKKMRFRWRDMLPIDRPLFRDFLRSGLPVIASNASWGIAMALQMAILGRLEGVLPANSIATTVFQIVSVVSYGAASASSVLIGKTVGEGRLQDAKQYAKTLQILYLFIGAATGLLLFFGKDLIVDLFLPDAATRALALQFMTVLSVTVVGTSYQVAVLTGIVRGGGDTRFVFFNDMIFMWGIVLPCAALAAFVLKLPPVAVFLCLKADQLLKCFVAVVKVNFGSWIRTLTREAGEASQTAR